MLRLSPLIAVVIALLAPAGAAALDSGDTGAGCDLDLDGHDALYCGGDDCNDLDATVSPGAEELPGDGLDQNCDGFDRIAVEGESPRLLAGGAGTCAAAPGGATALGLLLALCTLASRSSRCAR